MRADCMQDRCEEEEGLEKKGEDILHRSSSGKGEQRRKKGRKGGGGKRNQTLSSERMTNRLQAHALLLLPSLVSAWPCPVE